MTGSRDNEGHGVLHQLPLTRWATRLERGEVHLAGMLTAPAHLPLGEQEVAVAPGPVDVAFDFGGGAEPRVVRAEVRARAIAVRGRGPEVAGSVLVLTADEAFLDGRPAPCAGTPGAGSIVHPLADRLSDVSFQVVAKPAGELLVRLPAGVHVVVPATDTLRATGGTQRPPHALRLSRPLEIHAGGEGIRLSHRHFTWLARLARVRITAATLHPDGNVDLEGGASAGLDRAIRTGLHRTSSRLSRLVRTSPHFHRLRLFLKQAGEP